MAKIHRLPSRASLDPADTWDLAPLCASDAEWEKLFARLDRQIRRFARYRGRLGEGPQVLAECFKFDAAFDRLAERVGTYAHLKAAEDQTNSQYQAMVARYQNLATRAAEAASFIRPEILALSKKTLDQYLTARELAPWRLVLRRILRFKPHTLPAREEALLAMQGEMAQAASHAFRQLLDADMRFGLVKDEKGELVELSNATFSKFMVSPERSVRKAAFHQYYAQFAAHEHTLAATLAGSVHKDVYYARVRGYSSSLQAALFPDNVPQSVYDNLIAQVRQHLPVVHRYYEVRRRKMRLRDIHHYDTYVPLSAGRQVRHTWDEAVNLIVEALAPLGEEYCQTLRRGLTTDRWCDRYPNLGKQSGAFSSGTYDAPPYILMNYHPEVLNDVFTLAHEAGHSMHTWYSARHQPYPYYGYVIFVAEVASTFNEELLSHHLLQRARDDRERAYLIGREIDDIRGTIIRQTMFAEFEKQIHAMAEAGQPLTVQSLRATYRKLLEDYFGPQFALDEELSLECLRIPHFYRAFYVYKYATGLSAAIALSQRVLHGGKQELDAYLGFLKAGCSKDPLDLLRDAGVDMETPQPVQTALAYFGQLVDELDRLL